MPFERSVDGEDINPASVTTDDATINKSLTAPDGTTYTGALGGVVALNSLSPSGTANVDFVSDIDSTYNVYVIRLSGVSFATNDSLGLRVTTDGGSTFESGASAYRHSRGLTDDTGSGFNVGNTDSEIELTGTIGSGRTVSGTVTVYGPADAASRTLVSAEVAYADGNGRFFQGTSGGMLDTATAVDGVRIIGFVNGANIDGGTLSLSGVVG